MVGGSVAVAVAAEVGAAVAVAAAAGAEVAVAAGAEVAVAAGAEVLVAAGAEVGAAAAWVAVGTAVAEGAQAANKTARVNTRVKRVFFLISILFILFH